MSPLRVERSEAVQVITLSRPEARNALNPPLVNLLRETLSPSPGEGVRSLLIMGEGRAFSSGADLAGEGLPEDVGATLEAHFNPLMLTLAQLPIPVVTAVNGAAAGAACSLALAGDMILTGRSAYFLQAFINIGLVRDAGANWLLPRSVGRARAMEMLMLGEWLPAQTALEWGPINRVTDDHALLEEASSLAQRLSRLPTQALGLIRRLARETQATTFAEALSAERIAQKEAGETCDFKEGAEASLSKRVPRFSGR